MRRVASGQVSGPRDGGRGGWRSCGGAPRVRMGRARSSDDRHRGPCLNMHDENRGINLKTQHQQLRASSKLRLTPLAKVYTGKSSSFSSR